MSNRIDDLDQGSERNPLDVEEMVAEVKEATEQFSEEAKKIADKVEQFVVSRPATSLAIAAASGILIGLLVKRK